MSEVLQGSLFDLMPAPVVSEPVVVPEMEMSEAETPPLEQRWQPDPKYPADSTWLERKIEAEMRDRIKSLADAQAFVEWLGAGCRRATIIQSRFDHPFWADDPARLATCIAFQRNVQCNCHQLGTFEPLS